MTMTSSRRQTRKMPKARDKGISRTKAKHLDIAREARRVAREEARRLRREARRNG